MALLHPQLQLVPYAETQNLIFRLIHGKPIAETKNEPVNLHRRIKERHLKSHPRGSFLSGSAWIAVIKYGYPLSRQNLETIFAELNLACTEAAFLTQCCKVQMCIAQLEKVHSGIDFSKIQYRQFKNRNKRYQADLINAIKHFHGNERFCATATVYLEALGILPID